MYTSASRSTRKSLLIPSALTDLPGFRSEPGAPRVVRPTPHHVEMAVDPNAQQLVAALQQYPNNAATAIESLRTPAGADDRRARALMAWMLAQQGRWPEAATEVLTLLDGGAGVAYLPMYVGQNLIGQADQNMRTQGARLLTGALDSAQPFDPFAHAQQLVQQGDPGAAVELLEAAVQSRPALERKAWQELVAQANSELSEIQAVTATAAAERDNAVAEIQATREDAKRARTDMERLVQEVGGLANKAGAAVQADDYGNRADTIETRANRLTIASVALGAVIAIGALVLAISASQATDPLEAALEKLPISLPLLLLNFYIGGLAKAYREEAVALRHIELQIRTANPFLGALDEPRRKAVLAMLALRFFPGQAVSTTQTSESPDIAQALGTLLQQSDGRAPAVPNPTTVLVGQPASSDQAADSPAQTPTPT